MSLWDDGLFANAEIQYSDPSELYEISYDSQIGEGSFGKIFKVKRKKDGRMCALKFCQP